MNDLDSFGLIFEDMAVRDLRVFAEPLDGKLYHYRDSSGLECDTVLHRRNGTYALIEVKLGGEKLINDGAKALKTLAETIDTTKGNHGVGSPGHFQESDFSMLYYLSHSHFT